LKSQTILTHFKTLEMNFKNRFYKQTAHSSFFSIDNFVVEYHDEIKKEKETNKPIDLKPTNWNKYKETFYNQRIDKYKSKGFTKELIIGFELNKVKNLPNENEKYFALLPNESEKNAALKKYYTQLLNEKLKSEQDNPEQTKKQFDFKPTEFNKDGFKLFSYLIENYVELTKETGRKKRLSNVWHFMKNDNEKTDAYKFYFTKDDYKKYILETYSINIKNTDKSPTKYAEKDLPSLKGLRIQFEDMKKK